MSVLEVGDGVFEVLSTSGDTHLGGDDFDRRIVDFLVRVCVVRACVCRASCVTWCGVCM